VDRNLDQDNRQDNKQAPLQKVAMDKDQKTLTIPHLQTEYDLCSMEYHVGQYWVTCSVLLSLQVPPFTTSQSWNIRGLSTNLEAIEIIINMDIFCIPFLLLAQ